MKKECRRCRNKFSDEKLVELSSNGKSYYYCKKCNTNYNAGKSIILPRDQWKGLWRNDIYGLGLSCRLGSHKYKMLEQWREPHPDYKDNGGVLKTRVECVKCQKQRVFWWAEAALWRWFPTINRRR